MIITPNKKIFLPKHLRPSKRKQNGTILLGMAAPAALVAPVLNLDGFSVNATDTGAGANACEAGCRVNADGTIDEKKDTAGLGVIYTQKDGATDWIIPNDFNTRGYFIRATEVFSQETENDIVFIFIKNGTMNTWLAVGNGTSQEWSMDAITNSAGSGNADWDIDLEIATDSGGTDIVATGSYFFRGVAGSGGP